MSLSTVFLMAYLATFATTSPIIKHIRSRQRQGTDPVFRSVCYFPNWVQHYQGEGRFTVSDVDPFLCTHINFAFAGIVLTQLMPTENNDFDAYSALTSLRLLNPDLRVLLSVGGADSAPQFEYVSESAFRRLEFAQNTVAYLREHGFDGVDIDWEYPHPINYKDKFTQLLQTLALEFASEAQETGNDRLLLTAALAGTADKIENVYDLVNIPQYLDFANIMSYDYHGAWDNTLGQHAALLGFKSQNNTLMWYLDQHNFPPEKMNLGIPTYGRSFTLNNSALTSPGDPANGPAPPGPYTREAGVLAYYEICLRLMTSRYAREFDVLGRVPYAHDDSQWVGYDDIDSVTAKINLAKLRGLGGVMYWDLSKDDFADRCGDGPSPLINLARLPLLTTTTTPTTTTSTTTTASTTTPTTASTTTPTTATTTTAATTTATTTTPTTAATTTASTTTATIATTTTATTTEPTTASPTTTASTTTAAVTTAATSTTSATTPETTTSVPATTAPTTAPTTPTTTTEPLPSTEPTIPPYVECTEDGQFIRDLFDCSVYYQCVGNTPIRFECPEGLVFDTFAELCDYPINVDCSLTPTPKPGR